MLEIHSRRAQTVACGARSRTLNNPIDNTTNENGVLTTKPSYRGGNPQKTNHRPGQINAVVFN
jgi:hypothetical protein